MNMADDTTTIYSPQLNGRTILYSGYTKVDKTNIIDVLEEVYPLFLKNKREIVYLQSYRRGVQPIINREKKVRSDIKNIVIKNRANEIVNFKAGYLLGEPVQFVARTDATDDQILKEINDFNDYCYIDKKFNLDKELADYMYTCGLAYRMVLPNVNYKKGDKDKAPFEIYTLDPAFNAIVYTTALGHKPILSITQIFVKDKQGNDVEKICCYTDTEYFEIVRGVDADKQPTYSRVKAQKNNLGMIPIVEYPLNLQRLGAFEPVITLLDAINSVESNRVDAVEQCVQAIMVFYNLDMSKESIEDLKTLGAISLASNDNTGVKQDIKYLSCDLNQDQTQTLINSLEQDVLTLCGMPNRNGGTSTSDTGTAVIMRDGWSDAEARAKQDELTFRNSEIEFLKLALKITDTKNEGDQTLSIPNIDIRFTRKNYENITQKTTVLTQMLANDKIDPLLAFEYCGLFTDPQLACKQSLAYYEKTKSEQSINTNTNDNEEQELAQ